MESSVRSEDRPRPNPRVSFIIPTLDEQDTLPLLLSDLGRMGEKHEVIVTDGGSADDTRAVANRMGAMVVESAPGRGIQLARGAQVASAPLFCFLHADVRVSTSALEAIATVAASPGPAAYAFRLRIDGRGLAYRLIERSANLRSSLFGLPYGDQGLLVRREDYERAGGYLPQPLMEDVELIRSLKRIVPVRLLPAEVAASSRRWERDGPVRRSMRNLGLLRRYLAGESADSLHKAYPPENRTR